MGQHLTTINSQIIDLIKADHITVNSCGPEDINLFVPVKFIPNTTNCQRSWVKRIQNNLFLLTNQSKTEINTTEIDNVFTMITSDYERAMQEIKDTLDKSEQLKLFLISKLNEEQNLPKAHTDDRQQQHASSATSRLPTHRFQSKKNTVSKPALLKDILPILNQFIFDTVTIYDIKHELNDFNNRFKDIRKQWQEQYLIESERPSNSNDISLNTMTYLSSIDIFSDKPWNNLYAKEFSGQFISIFILAHIDFNNTIHFNQQFPAGSISFEFHRNTFKQLFNIIQQLTIENLNEHLQYILIFSLRLFTVHCKFLSAVIDEKFVTDHELQTWFDTLLILACYDNNKIEICQEASKALIYILNKKEPVFINKLSFIYKYIAEDKHNILIEQLNTNASLLSWIDALCDGNETAFNILYAIIDIYFNSSKTQQILQNFQKFLLIRLGLSTLSLAIKYITYILNHTNEKQTILVNDILIGLLFMTDTNKHFTFNIIQPIFTTVLPLLTEKLIVNNLHYHYWLLGKMSRILIIGSPQDSLELNYIDKLESPLFAGGCENENNQSDNELLMSIYNNTDQGAQLISKMKMYVKDKQNLLQKSIEQQANNACAALFSVYIKYYRRINLAKIELSRTNDQRPHYKLLSIFEYANRVQILFAKTKGQGHDCNELYERIKSKALFLLVEIKESDFIPIIESVNNDRLIKRQQSRRKIEKRTFRLIRNLFQACRQFKKLMLNKKKSIEHKQDNETILHKSIDDFVYSNLQSNELIQCMSRQNERAIIRLSTYKLINKFIEKILNIEDKTIVDTILTIYLPYLRNSNINWFYLENISATNIQLKQEIGNIYYSIIQTVLSKLINIEQILSIRSVFNLLNLSYKPRDIFYLHQYKFLQTFMTFIEKSDWNIMQFIGYNCFRLYVIKLCENYEIEEFKDAIHLVFYEIILNELKRLTSDKIIECKNNSLNFRNELCRDQWLMLLLRCIHFYEHIRSLCATFDYIKELIDIYRNSQKQTTILLALKILHKLIVFLPENLDEKLNNLMKNFFNEIFISIGNRFHSSDILTELIYIFRTLISFQSSWQTMVIEIILTSIPKSFDTNQIKNFSATLCILGGYIQPFCLSSIVQIISEDETELGVIVDTSNVQNYCVHYLETNKIDWISADKLRIEIDVQPPNLLLLPNANEFIHLLFDTLGYFIQLDTSTTQSLLLLQLKRQSLACLSQLLTNKTLVEIFIQKPYVSSIAKLFPDNIHLFNKHDLEQYCQNSKEILDIRWNDVPFNQNRLPTILPSLTNTSECYEWKANASKKDIQTFKQGRIGNDDIVIVPMPSQLSVNWLLEECGIIHQFPGRAYVISENSQVGLATFIVDQLRLNEGKWYYCVRLLASGFAQIGWATNGFNPTNTIGVGNDQYSWSYDGYEGMIYNNEQYVFLIDNAFWNTNDVCGCGIEIDGDNIRINYWLNGQFLGTPFAHQFPIGSSPAICNMLPNGHRTTFFPSVSLKVNDQLVLSSCEFIFHPEDMFECPLPQGYKPLVIPKLNPIDYSLVPYPYHAYLIDEQNYKIRTDNSVFFLRDFTNNCHLKTTFIYDKHQLILPEESDGFPVNIDHHESLTISFDFQILTQLETLDILLLTFDTPETFSIRIPSSKINHETQIAAIVFHPNDRQIKTYINNEYRIFEIPNLTKLNIHILPKIHSGIKNLAIWKYALSEEYIRRLFTFGVTYISMDYDRLNEYRKQVNVFTFNNNQQYFADELLVPFNEPFNENIWMKKKQQADKDEYKYFKSINDTNQATIQLFGNKTYLVLNKSIDPWLEYTFIIDILIDHYEQLTLITLNSQSIIYLTHNGELCLSINSNILSESKLKLNEYIRLFISVKEKSIQIYADGLLILNTNVDNDQLIIKDQFIYLFKEENLQIEENKLRIQCKSIMYLNKSTNFIDESMFSPPYSIIAPSLIQIGYDESKIKSIQNHNPTSNIQLIDTILREPNLPIDKTKLKSFPNNNITDLAEIILNHWDDIKLSTDIPITKDIKSTSIEGKNLTSELIDLNIFEQNQRIKSIEYQNCEHALISIYAYETILNLLKIWSINQTIRFPFEIFGNDKFIIKLLKHNEILDQMEIEINKTSLIYQLQIEILVQLILNSSYDKQSNIDFIFKLLHLFVKFINDKSTRKQDEIDCLVQTLFPVPLIDLLFDLFLVNSMDPSKRIILRLFSKLIQISENFNLNKHIQYYLFDLFIQYPSIQIYMMDLVYLLIKKQIQFDLSKFSQDFHDLCMIIDVIDALNDKTKHKKFPETFAIQSIIVLGDNNQFTLDDIEKSNSHFDTMADLQLISFMNNHPLIINNSFNEFINTLLDSTNYKAYPFLSHIPTVCIQIRAKLFYQLNIFIERLIPMIDFSQLPGESILTDKIRSTKIYILYRTKFQLFSTALTMTELPSDGNVPTVNFDTLKANDSHTMFSQAYEQLHDKTHLLFRRMDDHLWLAQYISMHSTDQGGPYRDSISSICSDICSARLPLFILCPNGRTNSGLNRDHWIPNVYPPNKPIPIRVKKQYQFIGQLMGMAIRQKHYLDLKFPGLLWKQLVREQVTIEDIEAIDAQSFTMINEMEKIFEQNNQLIDSDCDINDLLSSIFDELRYEVVSSAGQTYELVPDGGQIQITASNLKKYCSNYREYRLNEFHRQIEFIRQGLYSVIPGYFLNLYTSDELEQAVCGKGQIDVELLKRNTNYGDDYHANSQAVTRFWIVLSEMFTEEQKKLFLKFVWGRSTLPKCDDDFTSKFTIDTYEVSNGSVDGALPRAHTCTFVLDLPNYSSNDIMYDRLNYAITYCSSIDGDGNMNEAPTSTEFESD